MAPGCAHSARRADPTGPAPLASRVSPHVGDEVIVTASSAGHPAKRLGATLTGVLIAGIYIPDNDLPRWLLDVASVLPARPLTVALQFVPATTTAPGSPLGPVLVVLAWGAAGLIVARAPVLLGAAPG